MWTIGEPHKSRAQGTFCGEGSCQLFENIKLVKYMGEKRKYKYKPGVQISVLPTK
jgi:hypothetical protein